MNIGVPAERAAGETRVAATPETVKKLVAAKHSVVVESGAGASASYLRRGLCRGRRDDRQHRPMHSGAQMVLKVRHTCRRRTRADEARHGRRRHARALQQRRHRRDECGRADRIRARSRAAHDARAEHGCVVVAGEYRRLQGGADGVYRSTAA